MPEIARREDGRIDIQITPEQFMRNANAAQHDYNEQIAPLLGLKPQPLPYPEMEKD